MQCQHVAGEPLVQPRGINRTPSNSYTYKGSSQSAGGATYSGGAQSSFVSPGKQTAKEAMRRARKPLSMKHCTSIIDGLKTIYFNKVSGLPWHCLPPVGAIQFAGVDAFAVTLPAATT